MIKVTDIAFTAYPVTDIPRARNFYGEILGLKETMAEDFGDGMWWIEYEVGQGTLALTNYTQPSADRNGPNIALEVEDLDAAFDHLKTANVPIVEVIPGTPIMDTPVCRFFFVTDPDGNGINIHSCKHTK